ncbi:arylsulfatase B-like [Oratosquilla oratoria]|uniref:arylsulfatase B-like n=1 Tax=Oratosquilla oratoria TaxID=337810 RepID=UPI003F76645E
MIRVRVVCILSFVVPLLAANGPPNIVFMLADDLGWNDVSWHNRDVMSPHLQHLRDTGIDLNQNYVQPLCTPTRSALLTGIYPYKLGRQKGILIPNTPTGLTLDHKLLPQHLQALGYTTHLVGKWHLGYCNEAFTPTHRGFDTYYGFFNGHEDYFQHNVSGGYDFRDQEEVDWSAKGDYSNALYAERSKQIIRQSKENDKPFFLNLAFQNVHTPLQVPDKYSSMYSETLTESERILYGMVTAMDDTAGQIVQTLKDEGLYNNTIIIFSSDNGGMARYVPQENFPLRGAKGSMWEGGTRVPAFIHSPLLGLDSPRVYNGLFHVTDWHNTILEIASGPESNNQIDELYDNDGYSQWKALTEGGPSPRDSFIYNLNIDDDGNLHAALRKGDYKFMMDLTEGSDGPWLFDLRLDPNETTNLATVFPEMVVGMEVVLYLNAKDMVPADTPDRDPSGDASNWGGVWSPGWCKV